MEISGNCALGAEGRTDYGLLRLCAGAEDENEQKFASIEEKWEVALLEQKAELTMAFYDSVAALRDENEQGSLLSRRRGDTRFWSRRPN